MKVRRAIYSTHNYRAESPRLVWEIVFYMLDQSYYYSDVNENFRLKKRDRCIFWDLYYHINFHKLQTVIIMIINKIFLVQVNKGEKTIGTHVAV